MARLGVTKMIDRTFKTGPRRIFSVVYRSMPEGLVDVVDALRSYRCSSATNRPIFLHIPKTGGITVSRQIYGKEVLHNRQSVVEKLFDLHDSLRFVAIMREPIQRFISAANFIRTGGTMERRADYFRYYDDIDWEDIESIFFAFHFQFKKFARHNRDICNSKSLLKIYCLPASHSVSNLLYSYALTSFFWFLHAHVVFLRICPVPSLTL